MTKLTTPELRLPPPTPFDLTDDVGRVGWIEGDRVGFTGFADLRDAVGAAWLAHLALARRAAERQGLPPPYVEASALAIVRSPEGEQIVADSVPLALLHRPGTPHTGAWYGFEIVAAPRPDELELRSAAHLIHRVLRRSSLRWPPVQRASMPPDREGTW